MSREELREWPGLGTATAPPPGPGTPPLAAGASGRRTTPPGLLFALTVALFWLSEMDGVGGSWIGMPIREMQEIN